MSEIKLFNEDCMKVLDKIPDGSIDLIVSDVPYLITSRGNCGTMGGYMTNDIAMRGKIFDNNDISPKDYLPHFYRVLKDKTHCLIMINNINLQEMLNVATDVGFHFVKCLIWDKQNKICGRYYMNQFEYICLFRKGGQADKQLRNIGHHFCSCEETERREWPQSARHGETR